MNAPAWTDALPVPPCGARLHQAWMTTYEKPDARLLVEHFLPSLLGMTQSLSEETRERMMFFGELAANMETLRGRLTVISSPGDGAGQSLQYPWLWRYLSHFTVGAESNAVQHAKLWAFHWKTDDKELLELHVSSTNLTTSAFKDQLQAGWQALLPLEQRTTARARQSWGELITFLNALGISAGEIATSHVSRLTELLGRVMCPSDVTFIASIPGQKGPARRLKRFEPTELHVLTPTIGEWSDKTIADWGTDVGIDIRKIHLNWIAKEHPWATSRGWSIRPETAKTLDANGIRIDCLPNDARFTDEHSNSDNRWSHSKLYLFRSRRKKQKRLLITSANWSPSAWGAGRKPPRNFELGVVLDTDWDSLATVGKPGTSKTLFLDETRQTLGNSNLQWAEASWDGVRIRLYARSTDSSTPISAVITFIDGSNEMFAVTKESVCEWKNAICTPLHARFEQANEAIDVVVIDLRPSAEFAKTPLPEVDPEVATALREAFLLERYGGPAVDPDSISRERRNRKPRGASSPVGDYSVQAWLDAHAAFNVIDQWQTALTETTSEPTVREHVIADGHELKALYSRREGPAAELVAEEIGWLLKETN